MKLASRIIVATGSLVLMSIYFLPVWFIFLLAPQYPEGLTMYIWLNKLTGQVDIINGLNHYIGMKHISVEMFPEFKFLVYIVGFFILFGLVVAVTGKRKLLFAYLILTIIGGGAAFYDFYQWGYEYGHNLDPKAAIQVPGLSYQPPIFGHKKLLNFDAYSYPDIGGWIVVAVGACFFLVWFFEWRRSRRKNKSLYSVHKKTIPAVAVILVLSLMSCSSGPEKINYGKDLCGDCSMTIMDPKFASEIITTKGKIYKFDDIRCLTHFVNAGKVKKESISKTLFIDFENPQQFIEVELASFVISPQLKSPMNGNAIALSSTEKALRKAAETHGEVKNWEEITRMPEEAHHH